MKTLTILGTLEFNHGPVNETYLNFTLDVQKIIVEGSMIIGSRDNPYMGTVDIILSTGREDEDQYQTIGAYITILHEGSSVA